MSGWNFSHILEKISVLEILNTALSSWFLHAVNICKTYMWEILPEERQNMGSEKFLARKEGYKILATLLALTTI